METHEIKRKISREDKGATVWYLIKENFMDKVLKSEHFGCVVTGLEWVGTMNSRSNRYIILS